MTITWTTAVILAYAVWCVFALGTASVDDSRKMHLIRFGSLFVVGALIVLANVEPATKAVLVPAGVVALLFIGYNWERA